MSDLWAYQRDALQREIICTRKDIEDMQRGRLRITRSQGEAPAWEDDTGNWLRRSENRLEALISVMQRFD
ncbi:hypothetical protein NGM99_10440 [Mesorhizobium sp. RP14(2022)]|uniref:Uncharacterized protein n=1 Tax=Mesorhizobium liriopis TaxID=2953882 RepID=A0ABT1C5U9_9HYPH|nr:hypothetical protein [Mesorhizobium liriopis]MCO6050202.1 hypothetical protein [Mesorhizobium liriopis]